MKRTSKRAMSLILAFCMVISMFVGMPITAQATSGLEGTVLTIDSTDAASGTGWSWDGANLTLSGVDLTQINVTYAGDTAIILEGTNRIAAANSPAIKTAGKLTIKGSGTLDITGDNLGISFVNALTIDSGYITIDTESTAITNGSSTEENPCMTVNGGYLSAKGSSWMFSGAIALWDAAYLQRGGYVRADDGLRIITWGTSRARVEGGYLDAAADGSDAVIAADFTNAGGVVKVQNSGSGKGIGDPAECTGGVTIIQSGGSAIHNGDITYDNGEALQLGGSADAADTLVVIAKTTTVPAAVDNVITLDGAYLTSSAGTSGAPTVSVTGGSYIEVTGTNSGIGGTFYSGDASVSGTLVSKATQDRAVRANNFTVEAGATAYCENKNALCIDLKGTLTNAGNLIANGLEVVVGKNGNSNTQIEALNAIGGYTYFGGTETSNSEGAALIAALNVSGDGYVTISSAGSDAMRYLLSVNFTDNAAVTAFAKNKTIEYSTVDLSNVAALGASAKYGTLSSEQGNGNAKVLLIKALPSEPSITVGAQTGAATFGTAKSDVTYTIENTNFTDAFAPSVVWQTTNNEAPTGVTTSFSEDKATLTISTTAATPAMTYTFTVKSGETESANATLIVGKATYEKPLAPALASNTDTAIAVTAVDGQKYICQLADAAAPTAESTWSDSAAFTELNANTAYKVYTYIPADDNHNASAVSDALEVTTNKTAVTITIETTGKTYDGDAIADPTVSGNDGNGIVTYSYCATADGTYIDGLPTDAGTWYVKAAVTANGDYAAGTSEPTTVTIENGDKDAPTPPELSAKTYNSITVEKVEGQQYICQLASADAPTAESAWGDSAEFTVLSTNTAYKVYTRIAAATNYNASPTSAALDVTTEKAKITAVTAPTGKTLTAYYTDGDAATAELAASAGCVSENSGVSALAVEWTAPESYNSAPGAINEFTWTAALPESGNYEFAAGVTASGTVIVTNKAATAVSISITTVNKIYDGDTIANPTVSGNDGNGTVTYSYCAAADGTYENGLPMNAGIWYVKAAVSASGNYAKGTSEATTVTISEKELTVKGMTAADRPYDGSNNIVLSGGELDGIVDGDSVSVAMPTVGTTEDKTAAVGKTVFFEKIELSGGNADNYTLTQPSLEVNISAKELTVINLLAEDKTYDGNNNIVLSDGELDGVVDGDSVSVTMPTAGTTADSNAGTGKTVSFAEITLNGDDAGNYTVKQPTVTASIYQAELTVAAENKTMQVNKTLPEFTVSYTGFIGSDTADAAMQTKAIAGTETNGKAAGIFDIIIKTPAVLNDTVGANYTIAAQNKGSLTVTEKSIVTITADAANAVYNGNAQTGVSNVQVTDNAVPTEELVYTYTGTGETVYAESTTAPTDCGTYQVIVSVAAENTDYQGTSEAIAFAITKQELTVTGLTGTKKFYDGTTAVTMTGGDLVGIAKGDIVTANIPTAGNTADKNVGTAKAVSFETIVLSGTDAGNYTLTQPTAVVDIVARELTIVGLTAPDKLYNGKTNVTLTGGTLEGILAGDDVTATMPTIGTAVGADIGTQNVTLDAIALTGADAGNYVLTMPHVTVMIKDGVKFNDDGNSTNWNWSSESIYACVNAGIITGYEDNTFRVNSNLTRAEAAALLCRAAKLDAENAATNKLSDITGHWGEKYIAACTNAGIINGYEDGTFRPDAQVSRAEFAKMLVCAQNMQNGSAAKTFTDVSGHWAESFISIIASNGIVDGYEDGSFRPDNKITRGEAAKIIAGTYNLL